MPPQPRYDSALEELADVGIATAGGAPRRVATSSIRIGAGQAAGQLWPEHRHREHELLWGVTGGLTVSTPAASHLVPRGLAVWIPAGTVHEVHASSGTSVNCSWIAPELTSGPAPVVRTIAVSRLLAETLHHLEGPDLDDARRGRAELFAGDLLTAHVDRPHLALASLPLPRSRDLRALADAILDDPADAITIADLAAAHGLSLRTLTRRFRAETGMPLAQWRGRARIGAAARSLALGVPPRQAAREAGFASPSAFGAAFRRLTGVTPRAYAELMLPQREDRASWPERDSAWPVHVTSGATLGVERGII